MICHTTYAKLSEGACAPIPAPGHPSLQSGASFQLQVELHFTLLEHESSSCSLPVFIWVHPFEELVPRRLTRGSSCVPTLDWENTGENWLTHVQVFRVQPCKPKCSWGPGFLLASLGTSLCTWTSRTCQKVMFRLQSSVRPSPTTWDGQLSSVPTPQFYNLNNRICSTTTFQFLPDFSLVMSSKWIMTSETWISLSATLSHTSYFPLIILHFCASFQLSTSYYFYICQVHV